MSVLPEDLAVDVLSWLPVKSLLKFRCLSKSLLVMIDSIEFCNLHLSRGGSESSRNHTFIFEARIPSNDIESSEGESHCANLYVVDFDSKEKMAATISHLHRPFEGLAKIKNFYGCCNGLLLVMYEDCNMVLGNPCIKQFWKLPDLLSRPPFNQLKSSWGFGYDLSADDYKVVRLIYIDHIHGTRIMIYSLKSNSWKILPQTLPYSFKINLEIGYPACSGGGVLTNRALHWMMYDDRGADPIIMAIDLRTEKYQFLPPPPESSPGREPEYCELGVLEGQLCVMYGYNPRKPYFNMWRMKDYGWKESWTKEIIRLQIPRFDTCSCRDEWVRPIAYSQGRTKIFFQGSDHVMWYDVKKKELDQAVSLFKSPSSFTRDGYHFVASLVKPWPGTTTSTSVHNTKRHRD